MLCGDGSLQEGCGELDGRDKLQWKWIKGATTTKNDFESPLTTTDYLLCVYDAGAPVSTTLIPAGETCAGRPCWKETAGAYVQGPRGHSERGLQRHPEAGSDDETLYKADSD
jgi:hypothetical protein